jgi:hypothetical protein
MDAVEPAAVYPVFDFVVDGLRQAGHHRCLSRGGRALAAGLGRHTLLFRAKAARTVLFVQNPRQRQDPLFARGGDAGAGQARQRQGHPLDPGIHKAPDGHEKQDCEINASLRRLR